MKTPTDHHQEYREFMDSAPSAPPTSLSQIILAKVKGELHPSAWYVFVKLSIIHFMTSLITLSICPQFGFRVLGEGMGLMHYFMELGSFGCAMACGTFFLGASILVATLTLSSEEIRALRRNRVLELGALAFLSLGFFIMVDAEIVIGFAVIWFIASLIGGSVLLEAGWVLRKLAYAGKNI